MNQTSTLTPGSVERSTTFLRVSPRSDERSTLRRLVTGRADDAVWVRPALLVLLAATAVLYLWGLGASGWANSFYSAAVQAGSESWKAFFFGSSDASNAITVDKPPASLWPMELSVRIFGLSSWSILVPEALMGVGSVGLLYATVRRVTSSAAAGLAAGAVLALTPVAVLMFRFNNPDALLALLLTGAVYTTLRAIDSPARAVRWMVLGGTLLGFAFLTKTLQAFLPLPALAAVYLLAGAPSIGRRLVHLLIAFGSMIVAGGWWVAIVSLWPASSRPFVGGSQDNSFLELTFGYNGFGRLSGDEVGSVGGGATAGGNWGATGILRLFGTEIGGQIAWLLPAALIVLVAGLWFLRSSRRTDVQLAGLVVWGGCLLVTALVFSFMAGIFHPYYTVALAPAIAAVLAIGGHVLWQHRDTLTATFVAAGTVAFTAAFAYTLLDRTSDFDPWVKWFVAIVGFAAAFLLVMHERLPRRMGAAVAVAAVISMLAGPAAYAVDTAGTAHTGSIPSAGPSSTGGGFGGGGRGGFGGPTGGQTGTQGTTGGLLNGSSSTTSINKLLETNASSYTWVAAAIGSNTASGYQLATQLPVMAVGGFNGTDPSPTLAQFEKYVADGEIHYFIASGGGGGGFGAGSSTGTSSQITSWVEANFTATTVDGVTLYDLSGGVK